MDTVFSQLMSLPRPTTRSTCLEPFLAQVAAVVQEYDRLLAENERLKEDGPKDSLKVRVMEVLAMQRGQLQLRDCPIQETQSTYLAHDLRNACLWLVEEFYISSWDDETLQLRFRIHEEPGLNQLRFGHGSLGQIIGSDNALISLFSADDGHLLGKVAVPGGNQGGNVQIVEVASESTLELVWSRMPEFYAGSKRQRIGFRNALKVFHTLAFCWCSFRIANPFCIVRNLSRRRGSGGAGVWQMDADLNAGVVLVLGQQGDLTCHVPDLAMPGLQVAGAT
eukprot:symbB.v1.2.012627.t1/scaffold853.1/size308060/7